MPDCHFVTRRNFSGDFFARTEKVYYICIPIRPDNGHTVDVAQSVRASDCGSEGRGFESDLPPRWNGELNFDSPFFYFFSVGENGNSDENQVVSCNITR